MVGYTTIRNDVGLWAKTTSTLIISSPTSFRNEVKLFFQIT